MYANYGESLFKAVFAVFTPAGEGSCQKRRESRFPARRARRRRRLKENDCFSSTVESTFMLVMERVSSVVVLEYLP